MYLVTFCLNRKQEPQGHGAIKGPGEEEEEKILNSRKNYTRVEEPSGRS